MSLGPGLCLVQEASSGRLERLQSDCTDLALTRIWYPLLLSFLLLSFARPLVPLLPHDKGNVELCGLQ